MKLLRFGPAGRERPGLVDGSGRVRDISRVTPDLSGEILDSELLARLYHQDPAAFPIVDNPGRIGPCVGGIGKIVAVGLNYADHAAESGMAAPTEPILFMKSTSSLIGPNDPVPMPTGSSKLDWEIELGVVIGRRARNVGEADALDHVSGYCIVNDVSERAWQLDRLGQWVKGKSADGFCPIGPWLVTKDEIPDPQNLAMTLDVDGRRRQSGNTRTMVFGVAFLVSYISRFMTLEPGDLIATGTPPGVGMGQKPPVYLAPGNIMRLEIAGLGSQSQQVVS
ncbi:fumarylacetoacetate hydrolase family protein [Oceanibacterium hippocampi]|uniref:Ureidoglycolate lyase n=1 Tax=Oceanibacterium hippocampi TaxID=745714 RepID=A0A1Y5TWL4_9PROT|nr:fumarylacetoacetate hydrolase family protein [Oceanibacterium hippocampi]SLN72153.1 Ureidoglycolate lyase [Oceanibacterium hippocampi]